jgi:hypothetical protein
MIKITQYGKELDASKYSWDEKIKNFSTNENNLVLDFSDYDEVTFKTGDGCIFNTGDYCTFKTGVNCTFNTGSDCIFKTGSDCTFNTSYNCTFKTGSDCTFKTGYSCTFDTDDNCVSIRYDVKGIIEIPVGKKIKLNEFRISGYTFIEELKVVSCAGKVVEIDGKKYKLVESD